MSKSAWSVVSSSRHCPVCDHDDWCQTSDDGRVAMCMRQSDGAFKTKETKAGATAYFHWLVPEDQRGARNDKPVTAEPGTQCANADRRHNIYGTFLNLLELAASHRLDLLRRKARPPFTTQQYRTLPKKRFKVIQQLRELFSDEVLLSVPGFVTKTSAKGEKYLTISGKPGLLIPVRDDVGRIIGIKVRVDGATGGGGGKYRWLTSRTKANPAGPSPGTPAHCPLGIRAPVAVVRITEGPLKGDIATNLNCTPTVAADSAANWRTAIDLVKRLRAEVVRLAFDGDYRTNPKVAAGISKCASALQEMGLTVHIETWPTDHKGIDDLLAAGGTPEVLTGDAVEKFLASLVTNAQEGELGDRIEVEVTCDEYVTNDAAVAALASDLSIYQRGGSLVHIVRDGSIEDGIDRPADAPQIVSLPVAVVRERLTSVAKFVKVAPPSPDAAPDAEPEMVPCHPPDWCVKAVAGRGFWPGIRNLRGIVTSPILRRDGSILLTAGYDKATGLYFESRGVVFDVPDNPTLADAKAAAARLLELICDFPHPTNAHRSAWLAALLTPAAKFAFTGPAPLFMLDANTRGCGKSMEADLIALIIDGEDFARMSNPQDDQEARKLITSMAVAGDRLALIDNVTGQLGCSSLDAALTGRIWRDRILGTNQMFRGQLPMTWYASGNNIIVGADTSRRICHIRLESPEERPELRSGFRFPDLVAHVRANRAALLADVLMILRAFFVAGKPKADLPAWGSFEAWSDIVRQAIVWCGLDDPAATREELVETSDREAGALIDLIAGWEEIDPAGAGLTAAKALSLLDSNPQSFERMRNAVMELCNAPGGKLPGARQLGNRLRHLRGRVCDGKAIDDRTGKGGFKLWRVITLGESGDSADRRPPKEVPVSERSEANKGESRDASDSYSNPCARKNQDLFSVEKNIRGEQPEESPDSPESPSGDPVERRQLEHKDPHCDRLAFWEHVDGRFFCSTCWPCKDHRAKVREGIAA